ncbi:hypothetical protein RFI_18112, partial [Reticulomyxa filosa]
MQHAQKKKAIFETTKKVVFFVLPVLRCLHIFFNYYFYYFEHPFSLHFFIFTVTCRQEVKFNKLLPSISLFLFFLLLACCVHFFLIRYRVYSIFLLYIPLSSQFIVRNEKSLLSWFQLFLHPHTNKCNTKKPFTACHFSSLCLSMRYCSMGNANGSSNHVTGVYAMSGFQRTALQRLFSLGVNPDLCLLPFQMPRMQEDAPPTARERKTVRVKNICHVDKASVRLDPLDNSQYRLSFTYSCAKGVYVTIYNFATELTNANHCTIKFVCVCVCVCMCVCMY